KQTGPATDGFLPPWHTSKTRPPIRSSHDRTSHDHPIHPLRNPTTTTRSRTQEIVGNQTPYDPVGRSRGAHPRRHPDDLGHVESRWIIRRVSHPDRQHYK